MIPSYGDLDQRIQDESRNVYLRWPKARTTMTLAVSSRTRPRYHQSHTEDELGDDHAAPVSAQAGPSPR